jgi:hypothetical protein
VNRSITICTSHKILFVRMRRARHVTNRREKIIAYNVFVEKSESKRTLGRHRYRREDNIKMIFKN